MAGDSDAELAPLLCAGIIGYRALRAPDALADLATDRVTGAAVLLP